ncbi:MAG: beta-ketoacyl synthase chain length factor [Pseudomonadota bacterium]
MLQRGVSFSIAAHCAWAPGIETPEAWHAWAEAPFKTLGDAEPAVRQMPPMLRRRAGFLGKMALEVAYQCLAGRTGIPMVFCSRHGDVARAVNLLTELAQDNPLSPTSFGLAVHNANAGLFSIARVDQANHLALAAGASTIEHAIIEACSLLADGAAEVLLVAYDNCLPTLFKEFEDCAEQPHAWAWLMQAAGSDSINLSWNVAPKESHAVQNSLPGSLDIMRFFLKQEPAMQRIAEGRIWTWSRNA